MTSTPDLAATADRAVAGDATRTLTYAAALNEALARGDASRPGGLLHRRGHRRSGAGGGVFGVTRGLVERVRARARPRHAGLRGGDRRAGVRRGPARAAPGRRDHVLGLPDPGDGPDRQPGRQAALHVRRPGDGAAGHPHQQRRARQQGRPALPVARGVVHAHPGPKVVTPSTPARRQGSAEVGDPRRRPGHLPRAQAAVLHEGRGPGRRLRPSRSASPPSPRRAAHVTVVANQRSSGRRSRPPRRWPPRASSSRSSTSGRSARSTWRRISASVRKTGRLIVAHEANRTAGWGAEVVARVAEDDFHYLDAPIVRVAAKDAPIPFNGRARTRRPPADGRDRGRSSRPGRRTLMRG